MSSEDKFLYLKNDKNKFFYNNCKQNLRRESISDEKMLHIFDFFDTNKNRVIESKNSEGYNELDLLWNSMLTFANENENYILEEQEAEKFLINFKNNTNGNLVEQDITTTDLYKFFEILNNNPRVSQEEIDKYINFILNCINNKQTLVKDTVINDYISNSINETKNPELEDMRKIEILTKTNNIIDIYNNLNNNYTTLKNFYWGSYLDYVEKNIPNLYNEIIKNTKNYSQEDLKIQTLEDTKNNKNLLSKLKNLISKDDKSLQILAKEFQESCKVETLINYCKENNDDIGNYIYNEIYLKNSSFPKEIKESLINISEKYNVKIFPNKNLPNNAEECLNYIDNIFEDFLNASKNEALLPPIIDFTVSKKAYIDPQKAYNQGVAIALNEYLNNGAILINQMNLSTIISSLKHELIHLNDSKKIHKFEEGFVCIENNSIIPEKSKYYEDLLKLNIDKKLITYAYNNPMEFIAVAAESPQIKECSPEFKKILIEFGLPEWIFNI